MNQISREFFISKKTMEKQVAYGESVANNQQEIAAKMNDVGVIAVERKEVTHQIGVAKSWIDVSQAKTMQKERQRKMEI